MDSLNDWTNHDLFHYILGNDLNLIQSLDYNTLLNRSKISDYLKALMLAKHLSDNGMNASKMSDEIASMDKEECRRSELRKLITNYLDFTLSENILQCFVEDILGRQPKIIFPVMQKDEGYLLLLWSFYHIQLFGRKCIIIFDNGSTDYLTKKVLHVLSSMNIQVVYRFNKKDDYIKKGSILVNETKKYRSEQYVLLPGDIDEFICTINGSSPCFDPDSIRQSLLAFHDTLTPHDNLIRLRESVWSHPGSYKAILGSFQRVALHRDYNGPDIGWGLHYFYNWEKNCEMIPNLRRNEHICRLHSHFRPFEQQLATAREKLSPYVDVNDQVALRNYSGPCAYSAAIILGGRAGYESLLAERETRANINLEPEWAKTGLPFPFYDN